MVVLYLLLKNMIIFYPVLLGEDLGFSCENHNDFTTKAKIVDVVLNEDTLICPGYYPKNLVTIRQVN